MFTQLKDNLLPADKCYSKNTRTLGDKDYAKGFNIMKPCRNSHYHADAEALRFKYNKLEHWFHYAGPAENIEELQKLYDIQIVGICYCDKVCLDDEHSFDEHQKVKQIAKILIKKEAVKHKRGEPGVKPKLRQIFACKAQLDRKTFREFTPIAKAMRAEQREGELKEYEKVFHPHYHVVFACDSLPRRADRQKNFKVSPIKGKFFYPRCWAHVREQHNYVRQHKAKGYITPHEHTSAWSLWCNMSDGPRCSHCSQKIGELFSHDNYNCAVCAESGYKHVLKKNPRPSLKSCLFGDFALQYAAMTNEQQLRHISTMQLFYHDVPTELMQKRRIEFEKIPGKSHCKSKQAYWILANTFLNNTMDEFKTYPVRPHLKEFINDAFYPDYADTEYKPNESCFDDEEF